MTTGQTERENRWVRAVPGKLLVEHGPLATPQPGQALVRSLLIGVCGSDLHAVAGHHPFVDLPYRPGHEVVGIVEELGDGPAPVRVGDRVVVEPTLNCGHCKQCRRGIVNLCENLDFFGCGHPQGAMADRFTVRTDRLHVVPAELSDEQAALIEPLSTPVHAVRLASGARPGEAVDLSGRTVVILGAGTIGLLVLAAVRRAGAARIVVTDVLDGKRERALRLGADAVVDAAAPDTVERARAALGESADVVFDCVAIQPTVDQAIGMAQKGGTVVIVGVPAAPVTVPLPIIQDLQIRLQGSATYLSEDFATSMQMLLDGTVQAAEIVTLVVALDEVDAGFAAARSGAHIKVLLKP